MSKQIVTAEFIKAEISKEDPAYVAKFIGRALVALFNRQLEDEKSTNDTRHENSKGFSSSDAKSGTLTAKYFLKHKTLESWQVEKWTREERGRPRICKYARQLNEIAEEKLLKKHQQGV
jgi:hypothetical protein